MHNLFCSTSACALLSLLLSSFPVRVLSATDPAPSLKPCTIHSPSTGSFYDLRPLQVLAVPELDPVATDTPKVESWHSRGYDYPANFSINICGPVVEALSDVQGLPKTRWQNVSAFYTDMIGDVYSIGQTNTVPIFRGKKLILNYTNGSPCPDSIGEAEASTKRLVRRKIVEEDDDVDDEDEKPSWRKTAVPKAILTRKKSTLLSFICDTSPMLTTHPSISFLGTPDQCTYVFEVRSRWACPGATPSHESGTLGPGGVFGVIFGIALLVYLIGGCVYQRSVMHQRGWRQLPNYSVWAGLAGFFGDIFIILFSSCTRRLPPVTRLFGGGASGGGAPYLPVGSDNRQGAGAGTGGVTALSAEDDNRLIDQLDEEWDE